MMRREVNWTTKNFFITWSKKLSRILRSNFVFFISISWSSLQESIWNLVITWKWLKIWFRVLYTRVKSNVYLNLNKQWNPTRLWGNCFKWNCLIFFHFENQTKQKIKYTNKKPEGLESFLMAPLNSYRLQQQLLFFTSLAVR